MYENFNEFIKNNEKLDIKSEREFLEVYNGKSFLNGLYRIHNLEDREKCCLLYTSDAADE